MSDPKRSNPINNIFSVAIGSFLLIEGIWGLFSDVVFGIFTTSLLQAFFHIVSGIVGIIVGIKQNAGLFCILLGVLLLLIGLLYFALGTDSLFVRFFNVNKPVAVFNCIVGVLSLAVVYYRRPNELKN